MIRRRQIILGTTTVIVGFSGCSALSSDPATVNVTVLNDTETPHRLRVELFQNEELRPEARVVELMLNLEPGENLWRYDVAVARPYIVRHRLLRDGVTVEKGHNHYSPSGDGADDLGYIIDSRDTLRFSSS